MTQPKTVAFVCLHGSAKSLIATEHMIRLARARGAAFTATTSGPEPDAEVPPHVIEGLLKHGVDASHRVPEKVSARRSRKQATLFPSAATSRTSASSARIG